MQPSSSRPRNQARRRQNDDAAYMGPAKRQAADKADGEPRVKRKRVDGAGASAGMSALARRAVDRASDDGRRASVEGVLFFSGGAFAVHRRAPHGQRRVFRSRFARPITLSMISDIF